ncbi:MAG: N-acetyltransferase [Acidobacteria bacterium]|nr:N-acetyltransferase [Acidobacteriota bacterium]MBU4307687.1 N-acetyltransferase [Acidobacteriota bacterium]MBU4405271.1 N-acetyltransferase [Acidobacteriota bacterium]MCG2811196.1 N-acetyltransferase [Candidatus Aminicenantes bacterium]
MNSELQIKKVASPRLRREFILFPYRLYRDNPYWVPPLLSEEKKFLSERYNPFLKNNRIELFMCWRGNETLGRIAAILNLDHQRQHRDRCGFFGMFECVDDPRVAAMLLRAASDWLSANGADTLRGPTSFSLNSTSGLLIDGFSLPPAILMAYNLPYYQALLEKLGFIQVMRFFAYEVSNQTIKFPRVVDKLEKRLLDSGFRFRYMDFAQAERDMAIIIDLFNQAWADNWGFVPATFEEGLDDFKKMKMFAKPDLVIIAEKNGRPVGFSFSLPDVNQAIQPLAGRLFPFNWLRLLRNLKKIDRIRVMLMGVAKEYRNLGIDLVFYKKTAENAVRQGFFKAEMSWILESNEPMNRVLRHINAHITKTYAIYEKSLAQPEAGMPS